jgi:hypothetical protein
MRPTLIRLITGGALGIAFSVSLMLPGSVVFPQESPVRQLAAPEPPGAKVVRAAPVAAPKKVAERPRIVIQRVYVPTVRTAHAPVVVRHAAPLSKPALKHVERTQPPPPATQPVTPMSAPPTEPERAEKPEKAKKPKEGKRRKADKPRKSEKPKKAEKPKKSKDRGSGKKEKGDDGSGKKEKGDDGDKKDRGGEGDDRGHHDEGDEDDGGGGRGDDAFRG